MRKVRVTGLPLISVTQLDRHQPYPSNDCTPQTPERDAP